MSKRVLMSVIVVGSLIFSNLLSSNLLAKDEVVDITVHKVVDECIDCDAILNTGEIMDDTFNLPIENASFELYDVSDRYLELLQLNVSEDSLYEYVLELLQNELLDEELLSNFELLDTKITDENGSLTFKDLLMKDNYENYRVYGIVENKLPTSSLITTQSVPIILALPIYKLSSEGSVGETVNHDIHIYPKSQLSKPEKYFIPNADFSLVNVDGIDYFNVSTFEELNFELNFDFPINLNDFTSFKIIDEPTENLVLNQADNSIISSLSNYGLIENEDYTVDYSNGGFTVDFKLDSYNLLSKAGSRIKLNYAMYLNAMSTVDTLHENNARLEFDEKSLSITSETKLADDSYNISPKFITNGSRFIKRDSKSHLPLANAEFTLHDGLGNYGLFTLNLNNDYVFNKWVKASEASILKSNKDGKINVIGLKSAEYNLTELNPPTGYVKLSEDYRFIIISGNYNNPVYVNYINNHKKGILPSTGGKGRNIYLLIGSSLMLSALIYLDHTRKVKLK